MIPEVLSCLIFHDFPQHFLIFLFLQGNQVSTMSIIWCKNRKGLTSVVMKTMPGNIFIFQKKFLIERFGWRLSVSPKVMLFGHRWSNFKGNWLLAAALPPGSFTGQGAATIRLASWGHRCSSSARRWARPGQPITREVMTGEQSLVPIFQKYIFSLFTLCD